MEINNQKIFTNNISFGLLKNKHIYNIRYKDCPNYNGKEPDKQLIEFLKKYISNLKNASLADIGAGTGRNTFPISNFVQKITAFEQSKYAATFLKNKAPKNNIYVSDLDITKKYFKYPDNFDAVYMTHLTQHFTDEELVTVFHNLKNTVKNKGIVIFDALTWHGKAGERNISEEFAMDGSKSFYEKDLINIAKSKGFSLIETCDYAENEFAKAEYTYTKEWGGLDKDGKQIFPVKLKWFVFKLN